MNNNQDISLDLFDIDENDVEHEYEYDDQYVPISRARPQPTRHDTIKAQYQPQYQQDYASYQLFHALPPPMPVFGQPTFADHYMGNSSMENNVTHYHNHGHQQHSPYPQHYQDIHPSEQIQPIHRSYPISVSSSPEPEVNPTSCTVCSRQNPSRLAILVPCKHALCSACLTSALNIVGEKDMECAVCKKSVADFKLVSGSVVSKPRRSGGRSILDDERTSKGKSFFDSLTSSPGSTTGGLESAFEFERGQSIFGHGDLRASTPPPNFHRRDGKDSVVLRIDNVPWVRINF